MNHKKLIEIASEQETPFYVYDIDAVRRNYTALSNSLPKKFQILYSLKANPHAKLLAAFKSLGAGADVASKQELAQALAADFAPSQISYVGPAKSQSELLEIVDQGLLCTVVESLPELDALLTIAREGQREIGLCVRVNPFCQTSFSGAELVGHSSQFGIDEDLLPQALARLKGERLVRRVGLHFYLHSQFLQASHIIKNIHRFLNIGVLAQNMLDRPLDILNLGGGFGIPYFDGQLELDLSHLSSGLNELMESPAGKALLQAKMFVESGRYLVGQAGVFVCRVVYRKQSYGKTILVCDGGFAHHLAATGVGQVLRKNFPMEVLTSSGSTRQEIVTIAGPSCYGLDIIGQDVTLPEAQAGDLIVVHNSGAYGYSFSPGKFLSPRAAAEIVLPGGCNG